MRVFEQQQQQQPPPQQQTPTQEAQPVMPDLAGGQQPPIDVQHEVMDHTNPGAQVSMPPGVANEADVAKFQNTLQQLKHQNGG